MNVKVKVSIARILIDIIKADEVLDISEMEYFRSMRDKYKIENEHLIAAQKIDFASAVNSLQQLSPIELKDILNDMEMMSKSDGNCAPEEAFLLIALRYCLNPNFNSYSKLISSNDAAINIDKKNIVYTETQYDKDANEIIEQNLRFISDDFKVVGLEFVYIPQIAKDFSMMNETYLHEVITFLAPTLGKEEQDKIYNTLRTISTKDFCYEFLMKKMGLDPIFDSDPSILLQVGKSNDRFIYLHIALNNDIISDLRDFVDLYKRLTKFNISILSNLKDNYERFFYSGFHKALFDFLAYPGKRIESRVLINTLKKQVLFLDLGEPLSLSTKQLALYILIIQQSICTNSHELPVNCVSDVKRRKIKKAFDFIYGKMSDSDDTDLEKGLTPSLSHIKAAIKKINFLDNVSAYIPERLESSIRVKIKPSKVFVDDDQDHRVPILESAEWKDL